MQARLCKRQKQNKQTQKDIKHLKFRMENFNTDEATGSLKDM